MLTSAHVESNVGRLPQLRRFASMLLYDEINNTFNYVLISSSRFWTSRAYD